MKEERPIIHRSRNDEDTGLKRTNGTQLHDAFAIRSLVDSSDYTSLHAISGRHNNFTQSHFRRPSARRRD